MIQRAKIEVFGYFLEFGWSDVLHTAFFDCAKWSLQLVINIAHAGSFKNHKNSFMNDPKCQKRGFMDLLLMDRLDIAYDDRTKWCA